MILLLPTLEIDPGDGYALPRSCLPDFSQSLAVRVRRGLQQNRLHYAENGGIDADSQCYGKNDNERKAW